MLFNVVEDPFEYHDVAAQYPDIVQQLWNKILAINSSNIPQRNSPQDPRR